MPRAIAILILTAVASGCAANRVPSPRDAAESYAKAAAAGDADAIYEMMSDEARRARTRDEVRRIVASERGELADQAKSVTDRDARVEANARLKFGDGEEVALDLRDGRFQVTSAGALPGGGKTPEEALEQLRRVLARRSYAGLMRVLSASTRAAVEQDLRSLVEGLNTPVSLRVQVNGDTALVAVPGGHHVRLKRESGVWRVDNFD